LRNCGIALVVGVIIGFCIPKEYESTVVLAPEYPAGNSFTGMSSLASFAGINMHEMQGSDALYPELYPQIIESTIFLTDLYNMQVSSSDGEINTTLYEYIAKKQRIPWWEHILFIPLKIKAMLTPKRTLKNIFKQILNLHFRIFLIMRY
jgi:hypothetical protein